MPNNPNEAEIARPDSWKTVAMPATVASLPLNKTYTAEEFSLLASGFVPKEMEDKWFVFMQNNTLFFHRSWTGLCIYKVVFEQHDERYVVREAFVNRDTEQYNSTDNNYETALLSWLIDSLLLHKRVPFPLPSNLPKDAPSGLFQHHIAGTGFPEQSMNSWRGYLAASLGGATGAVVLTAICLFLAYVYVRTQNNGGLEGLVVLLLCSYAGFGIGEVLGCWLALRLGGYANASRTTNLLAGLTCFAVLVFFSNIPMALTRGINAAFWLLVGLTSITLPLLARFLAR